MSDVQQWTSAALVGYLLDVPDFAWQFQGKLNFVKTAFSRRIRLVTLGVTRATLLPGLGRGLAIIVAKITIPARHAFFQSTSTRWLVGSFVAEGWWEVVYDRIKSFATCYSLCALLTILFKGRNEWMSGKVMQWRWCGMRYAIHLVWIWWIKQIPI